MIVVRPFSEPVIIVYGWGQALNDELASHGITTPWIDNRRVTPSQALPHLYKVAVRQGRQIAAATNGDLLMNVFTGQRDQHSCSGYVTSIDLYSIIATHTNGITPVVSPLATSPAGLVNVNADDAADALAKLIKPKRYYHVSKSAKHPTMAKLVHPADLETVCKMAPKKFK